MKLGKVILSGIVVGILSIGWGALTCGKIFNWVYQLEPIAVWKTPQQIPFVLFNISTILFSLLLAFVYAVVKNSLPGKTILGKGLAYGILVWLVGCFPGCAAMGFFTVINPTVISYWIISGLLASVWQGIVIAAIYR